MFDIRVAIDEVLGQHASALLYSKYGYPPITALLERSKTGQAVL